MSWADNAAAFDRKPCTLVRFDIEHCQNTYGSAPCTAPGSAGDECYQTWATCQDPDNYTSGDTVTIALCDVNAPEQVIRAGYTPCITGITMAPTKIDLQGGIGQRASVSIQVADFTDGDTLTDPYYATRAYTPKERGSFWPKLLARWPHYVGRSIDVYTCFSSDPLSLANDCRQRRYIIEAIASPDARGMVTITAKDPMRLADAARTSIPALGNATLNAALAAGTSGSVSIALDGDVTPYPTSSHAVINDEVILYIRSGATITYIERGLYDTAAAAHSAGDEVRHALVLSGTVNAVLYGLLFNYAGIDTAYYDSAQWTYEGQWWASYSISALIHEGTSVADLVSEICRDNLAAVYWDEVAQKIKLLSIVPRSINSQGTPLTETDHLLANSLTLKSDPDQRVSQVWLFYSPKRILEDTEEKNSARASVQINALAEDPLAYGDTRIRRWASRWIQTEGHALATASRVLNRFPEPAQIASFSLDARDAAGVDLGQLVSITARNWQDETGAQRARSFMVISRAEKANGTRFDFLAQDSPYTGRYAFVGPNTLADYGSASAQDRLDYGFIEPSSGGNYLIL